MESWVTKSPDRYGFLIVRIVYRKFPRSSESRPLHSMKKNLLHLQYVLNSFVNQRIDEEYLTLYSYQQHDVKKNVIALQSIRRNETTVTILINALKEICMITDRLLMRKFMSE